MNRNLAFRKVHYWGAIVIAIPMLVMIVTGILLMLKKNWSWVQPVEQAGSSTVPTINLDQILAAVASVPESGVQGWGDVDRFDVRPGKGIVKIQSNQNRIEVQVDLATGAVLQTAVRRSDLLETLHDGSWFHDRVKLWIFLPAGVMLFALWVTGMYLFFLPYVVRARRRKNPPVVRKAVPAGD